jgi:dipeptidyl aminopeptidase/acylaminoacyl peptidase
VNDWGTAPTSDVLTALDKHDRGGTMGRPTALLVTGGSYAGYLVAWIIAHMITVSKLPVRKEEYYDLATFFGEGNAWRLVPIIFRRLSMGTRD